MSYPAIKAAALSATWAINKNWLEAAMEQARGGVERAAARLPAVKGNIAVIPIYGMITQRGSVFDMQMGGTSTQAFEAAFSRALHSSRVGAIVLDVDSPGGTTPGVEQAADRVYASRGNGKPVVAVANSMAASAAYWIASAAETFVASPGGDVGSIGVFRMHEDHSQALEQAGIKVSFFAQPPGKVAGNPFESVSGEEQSHQMGQVTQTFDVFAGNMTRQRGLSKSDIMSLDGHMFHANDAKSRGMVDRVATMDRVFRELGVGKAGRSAEAAATQELVEAWESCEVYEPKLRRKEIERRRLALDAKAG